MKVLQEIRNCFGSRFEGRSILVTGHTGFKGSWLCLWLEALGARVAGYSLPAPTNPSHFQLLDLRTESHIGDVRDLENLRLVCRKTRPELVVHMAAQPLVRYSYNHPVETFTSNITGTMHVLEAVRSTDSVRAVICVTSDKVYENVESNVGYRESSRLGGHDPYSSSKACSELVVSSYRESFFPVAKYKLNHQTLIATARAGNVIGGGDWAADRLIPDAVRAATSHQKLHLRNPDSIRPWQHVLEPLAGYLLLADRLLAGEQSLATAMNFGPDAEGTVRVGDIADVMRAAWPALQFESQIAATNLHETGVLKLDSTLARESLQWNPVWEWRQSVRQTTNWYRSFYEKNHVNSLADLALFVQDASAKSLEWAT